MTEKGFFQEIKDKSFLLISAVQSNLRNTDTEGTKQSVRTVLERCPYKRGHYDDVTFMTPLTVLTVQQLKPGSHSSLNYI